MSKVSILPHQIYINARVHTMDTGSVAEAVVVEWGLISYVGSQAEALREKRWYSRIIDVKNRFMLPGFVDAHSHFLATGLTAATLDLNPSPGGEIDSLEDLYEAVEKKVSETPAGEWVIGINYDNTVYTDGQHPDKTALDFISIDHPIYLRHSSGHMGVGNSVALDRLAKHANKTVSANATDSDVLTGHNHSGYHLHLDDLNNPHIGRKTPQGEPNGLLQEAAAPPLELLLDDITLFDYLAMFKQSRGIYVEKGFSTVQEGSAGPREHSLLLWLSRLGFLPMRVVVWLSHDKLKNTVKPYDLSDSSEWLIADTIKLISDGSPQGYTAYLSKPYHQTPEHSPDFRGQSLLSSPALEQLIKRYTTLGYRIAVHANGDAAIDNLLTALQRIDDQNHTTASSQQSKHPITLVHGQIIRNDQLNLLTQLNVAPTFFSAHTYHWGDWHREQSLGEARANNISPLATAESLSIRFSIHSDAPVTPPDPMALIWSATTRETRSGKILGLDQRITRQRALEALTIDAARQNGLTDRGLIKAGKLADFVILSDNPLTVEDARTIKVLETIVGGRLVYKFRGQYTY